MSTEQTQMQIRIRHDDEPINWREEGEPVGKMVYTSTRYVLGDERVDDPLRHMVDEITDPDAQDRIDEAAVDESQEEYIRLVNEAFDKEFVRLPVYAYIHSGIALSTQPFSCPWDSGQCGIIYARRDLKEFDGDEEKIKVCLEAEVKSFARYLAGDIWGFEVYSVSTCDRGHEHEEVEDSCWGFENTEDVDDMVATFKDHVGDAVTEQQIREAWEARE